MKKNPQSSAAHFFLKLFIVVFFIGYMYPAAFAKEARTEKPGRTIRIAVKDFKGEGGAPRYDILSYTIPHLLKLALLPDESFEIFPGDALLQEFDEKKIPRQQLNQQKIFNPAILRNVNIDYLLTGSFIELQETIQIKSTLFSIQANTKKKIEPIRIKSDDLFAGMTALAEKIALATKADRTDRKIRRFAITCFQDSSPVPTENSKWFKRDIAVSLPVYLRSQPGIRLIEWDKLAKYCDSPIDNKTLAARLNADAVIGGFVKAQGNRLSIYPEIFIVENNLTIDVPYLEFDVDEYLEQKILISSKMNEFIDAILTDRGTWNITDIAKSKDEAEDYLKHGKDLFDKGNLKLAAIFFQKVLNVDPDHPDARYYLGACRLEQKRYEEAVVEFSKAVAEKKDYFNAYEGLGYAYSMLERYSEAIDTYKKALDLNPDLVHFYRRIGIVHLYKGEPELATKQFLQAIEKNKFDTEAHYYLGYTASTKGDYDKAIGWYKAALEISPAYSPAREGLAFAYSNKGFDSISEPDYKNAIQNFTQSISYHPTAYAYFYRAYSYSYELDWPSAIRDYLYSIELGEKESGPFYYLNSAFVSLTEVYILNRQYNEAKSWAQKSIKKFEISGPEDHEMLARLWLIIAEIMMEQNYTKQLNVLQNELMKGIRSTPWDFSLLEDFIMENKNIGQDKQKMIIKLIKDVQSKT